VPYKALVDDAALLQELQSVLKTSIATLIRCDAACVRLSSIVRDQRLRSSTGCSVDIYYEPCAVASSSSPQQPFLTLLSGFHDPHSMFYRLDGLSFASSILTPEQAASAPANDSVYRRRFVGFCRSSLPRVAAHEVRGQGLPYHRPTPTAQL
jgi:hypothetical protein